MNSFTEKLILRLRNELPGEKAQFRLAPESRPIDLPNTSTVSAGVLILIYPNIKNELCTVFMKRPEYDGHHSAQISFPGGKYEDTDSNITETALRESHEEIGININSVEIIGKITPLFIPVSNFLVYPIIGILKTTPLFDIDRNEVDYLIECSLNRLIYAPIKQTEFNLNGNVYKVPYYDINNEIVWGATSMILSELIDILSDVLKDKL